MQKATEIFKAKKARMLVLTMPVKKAFISAAPKYKTPMTVVKQSMEPIKIRMKLGKTSDFNMYIEAFSFLLKT